MTPDGGLMKRRFTCVGAWVFVVNRIHNEIANKITVFSGPADVTQVYQLKNSRMTTKILQKRKKILEGCDSMDISGH